MSEGNNINELSAHKAGKLAAIVANHYADPFVTGFDEVLIELGRRGEELNLLPNDVVAVMCVFYNLGWGHNMEEIKGDVLSAFYQFEMGFCYFEQAFKDKEAERED